MEESSSPRVMTRYRFPMSDTDHSGYLECSTQNCRTCSAFAMGDCIALTCCPCSVVNLLAFSFVKAPYVISRRWIKTLKKKKGLLPKRVSNAEESDSEMGVSLKGFEKDNKDWRGELDMGVCEYKNINSGGRLSTKIEADKILMDMYQVGHWGFGRSSFSANPTFAKDMIVYQNMKGLKGKDE